MNSKIYLGSVEHSRFQPVTHTFKYPIYFYGLDLDELTALDQSLWLFGYNRLRPASIHDSDYLDDRPWTIREKLIRIVGEKKPLLPISSILMITSARYLNYIFNPVSFYYCFDNSSQITAMVVEVNNTFGERHIYIPDKTEPSAESDETRKYHTQKAFHVSPFNNMEGSYEFFFSLPNTELDIRINLIRDKDIAFSAWLRGTSLALTSTNLLKMMIRHPMVPHLTKPRIFLEAARLYFAKNLKYHEKPEPFSPMTIKRTP